MAAPLPGAALRRPAPARRRGPRARRRPAADADGRAVRRDRPDQPRAAPERVPAPAGRDPQDDRLRHPRHRRGDQDGRPHRDPAGGRQARAVRAAGGAADAAPRTSSSRTSSAPTARSSGSRSSACATSTCGRAPLVRAGEPVAEARAASRTPTSVRAARRRRRPAARLALERDCRRARARRAALVADRRRARRHPARRAVRPAGRRGPVRRRSSTTQGRVVGVLSIELLAHGSPPRRRRR